MASVNYLANVSPNSTHRAMPSSFGVSLTINPSSNRLAPAASTLDCQSLIHSPSPHPYEPNRATLLPPIEPSASSKNGSNSASSRTSYPIDGQPNIRDS